MMKNRPSEKGCDSKGRVQCRVCVGADLAIDLAPSTEPVEGVEEPWAHETDKSEEYDLRAGMIEESSETGWAVIFTGVLGSSVLGKA